MEEINVRRWTPHHRASQRSACLSALITFSVAATVTVMASAAMGSESLSLATAQTVRVRVHWVDRDRAFFGDGKAVAIVGDSLHFDRLLVWREWHDSQKDDIGRTGVHLPSLDRIQVMQSSRRHGRQGAAIGGLIGFVLGVVGTQVVTETPFGTRARNRDAVWAMVGGSAFGALLGSGIGALHRTEKWEPVDPDELRGLLQGESPPR